MQLDSQQTQVITLDCRLTSELRWDEQLQQARGCDGIIWNLDLGLFEQLKHPVRDEGQFNTLALAVSHFRDTVWLEFAERSIGVILYHGDCAFHGLPWDDIEQHAYQDWCAELECFQGQLAQALYRRSICSHYLDLLGHQLPFDCEVFAILDAGGLTDGLDEALLTCRSGFRRVVPVVTNGKLSHGNLNWRSGTLTAATREVEETGVLLPERLADPQALGALNSQIADLLEAGTPFRSIAESLLVAEWHGLERLYYHPDCLGPQGLRKLRGFEAAGGELIAIQ